MIELGIINGRLSRISSVSPKAVGEILKFAPYFLDCAVETITNNGDLYLSNDVDGTIEEAEQLYAELERLKYYPRVTISMKQEYSQHFWDAMRAWSRTQ